MANEQKKEEIREARMATDSNIRELQQTVDALPRTDHMTLPAIQVVEIDEQTRARAEAILAINNATNPDEVVGEDGRTLQQVRNEFEFGVSDLSEQGAKHEIQVTDTEEGVETVVIIPPVRVITNEKGEEVEVRDEEVTIEPTPANIAPVDAEAPHNPVEAREAAGLNPDGSEGDAQVIPGSATGSSANAPVAREAAPPQPAPKNLGTQEKVGGGQDSTGANAGGNTTETPTKTV